MAGVGPQVVQVLDFATARAPELQALHELAHSERMRSAVDAKLDLQKNQRRRRANAFKSHRMPQRLRMPRTDQGPQRVEEEHISLKTLRGGLQPSALATVSIADEKAAKARAKREQKPRCRKHRRRMHLLLHEHSWLKQQEANASAGDQADEAALEVPKWLATHAWHAKRMKMTERYGHILAERRQDKSVSAALTALRKTATLHDASYYGVLELCGSQQLIVEVLQQLADPGGSDIDDPRYCTGRDEGQFMLHQPGEYPNGAIAPVQFMWRPVETENEGDQATKRQLWLWIHPAAFMEAAAAIAGVCHDVMSDRDGSEQIEILDRRGQLARLQLRGKQANAILQSILQRDKREEGVRDLDRFKRDLCPNSRAFLDSRDTSIVSLMVQDPRLRSRLNNSSATTSSDELSLLTEPPASLLASQSDILCPLSGSSLTTADNTEEPDSALLLAQLEALIKWTTSPQPPAVDGSTSPATYPYAVPAPVNQPPVDLDVDMESDTEYPAPQSPLWSVAGRQHIHQQFKKDHELNGDTSLQSAAVPLLLVHRPASFPDSSGWDLILSPLYAPAFLNAFVFASAMVIGLDEHEALATVAHTPSFPRDFPDTVAGQEYWERIETQREDQYAKKPKAKRVPYDKLGVDSPFRPSWGGLFASDGDEEMNGVDQGDGDDEASSPTVCVLRGESYMEPFAFSDRNLNGGGDEEDGGAAVEFIPVAMPTLIRVSVVVPRRGTIEPCSLLYNASADDIDCFRGDAKWSGRDVDVKDQLPLLGSVTSAVYDRPKSAFRGLAFCGCEQLQWLVLAQRHANGDLPTQLLAMTRATTSRQLRPVILLVEA